MPFSTHSTKLGTQTLRYWIQNTISLHYEFLRRRDPSDNWMREIPMCISAGRRPPLRQGHKWLYKSFAPLELK